MLDGRVKTLHPRVHGGLLYIRGNTEHEAAVAAHGIVPIDMVVVNLYAFEKTAAQSGVAFGRLIENIDIGGPSMVRSAAKNFEDVAIVTRVADYPALIQEMKGAHGGAALTRATRWRLAKQAFALTAAYDAAIANTLERIAEAPAPEAAAVPDVSALPATLRVNLPLAQALRYGENPHQRAALYADGTGLGIAGSMQWQGKELSYNNLVDLDACWELAQEFPSGESDPAVVVIVKHTNPCGAATGTTILEAYQKALECDPVSAFGGVIGINRVVDGAAAEEIAKLFVEAIAAPGFSPEARERFAAKKNLRLVEVKAAPARPVVKNVSGGLLLQDADTGRVTESELKVVTWRPPTAEELRSLLFAWRVCEAREVERNCVRARRADAGRRRGADEPRGRGQIRRHEGGAAAARLRGRF